MTQARRARPDTVTGALPAPRPARRLFTWFRPRLRTKITLPYVILALLLAIGATFFVTRQMTASLQDQFLTFLRSSGGRAADGVVDVERGHLALLRQLAFTTGVPEAAAEASSPRLQELIVGAVVNARADVVEILDAEGRSLLSMLHVPGGRAQDYRFLRGSARAGLEPVQRVLRGERDDLGDKFTDLALDLELAPDLGRRHVLATVGPLKLGDERVGAILLGTYLDGMVARLSRQALAPVTLYGPGGEVLATSLTPRVEDALPLAPDLYERLLVLTQTTTPFLPVQERAEQQVGSQLFVEAFGPLRVRARDTVALFSVALPRDAIVQAGSTSTTILVVLNSLGLFGILVVGILLARAITGPILDLVGLARRVARGELDVQVEARSTDEIGILQRAFQGMIEGLRERDLIRETFGRFVDREVAEQILSGGVELGGAVKNVSVFFSDIRGFTALSSQLKPDQVVEFLNEYIGVIVDAVAEFGGVVNKFGGDSTLVIFGAPIEAEDHADRAVRAALEVRRRLKSFNQQRKARGLPTIRTGFGINTGEVVAGNIGSSERMEYTVIGDTVNLSSRVQGLNKEFPQHDILITQATYKALGRSGDYAMQDLGPVAIRGLDDPVRIYAVLDQVRARKRKSVPSTLR